MLRHKISTPDLASEVELRQALMRLGGGGWLTGDAALAAIVLWSSGQFDTSAIAAVLTVREDAVCRTLAMARDGARADARAEG
ncbi:MAG: hypothetical protein EOR53_18090 [Mesorhizobium sp.]|uniref:hypothetical protein n=1 Tax=Mesorhizobium sp. TaxID=1871066 RepID=UPI000FE6818A|nr:hypothetical protein [Mesorhizobium sp.]RWK94521.1 MAG: hypothetical protein EOR53_18090 [Mesorhizobium sp.]